MSVTAWMRLAGVVAVLVAVAAIGFAWRSEVRDRAQLAGELAVAKQALDASETRQRDRDAKLADTLTAIEAAKHAEQSPAEIVKALLGMMRLPAAITLQTVPVAGQIAPSVQLPPAGPGTKGDGATQGKPSAPETKVATQDPGGPKTQEVIPSQDLKPMYNFARDCQECQAKLSAAQGDLLDEKAKTKTLTKERDDALRTILGGSILARVGRASKWLLIGAAAGAVAARAIR